MTLLKKLPVLVTENDYHDFDFLVDTLNDAFLNTKIKFKELGLAWRQYVAVFYFGKAPTTEAIIKLLQKKYHLTVEGAKYFLKAGYLSETTGLEEDKD